MGRYRLEYRVVNYDTNRREVVSFNVFDNIRVNDGAQALLDRFKRGELSFDELDERLDRLVAWQEWARCEYEVQVGPWPCGADDERRIIDCYTQYHVNHTAAALGILYANGLLGAVPDARHAGKGNDGDE